MNKYFNPKLIKRHKRYNIIISARESGKSYYMSELCKKRNGLIIRKERKL